MASVPGFSRSVAANLPVSLELVCSFEQVIPLEYSVHSVLLADQCHSPLEFSFFVERTIIGKKVQLVATVIGCRLVRADTKPAVQEPVVCFLIERGEERADYCLKAVCLLAHSYGSIAVLRVKAAVKVRNNGAFIIRTFLKAFVIIGHPPGEASRNRVVSKHIGAEHLDHFPEDIACLLVSVRSWKNLSLRER